MFYGCHRDLAQLYIIFLSTNDHGYVPFVVITLVVSSALGLQQWVSRVEQALLTHPESMGLIPVLSRIFGARSFVLCVVFCRYIFPFSFWSWYYGCFITPLVSSNFFIVNTAFTSRKRGYEQGSTFFISTLLNQFYIRTGILLTCG